jgi:hypothetical protein
MGFVKPEPASKQGMGANQLKTDLRLHAPCRKF